MPPSILFNSRRISSIDPTYIVAEIGVNHNGNISLAHKLIDSAKDAGADAVKFQTYVTDELVIRNTRTAKYQKENALFDDQYTMLEKYELSFESFHELYRHCAAAGIDFLSTPFDPVSLRFIANLKPVAIKWASGELTNKMLLDQAAKTRLPIILSTGMSRINDVDDAITWIGRNTPLVVLQCVSNYPAAMSDQNLRVLPFLENRYQCPVGFSDHTQGFQCAIAAKGLGMSVLEKHFTLDRNLDGPDHKASVDFTGLKELVSEVRSIEVALGNGVKLPAPSELDAKTVARKSLFYARSLKAGHIITKNDLAAKRPSFGIPPSEYEAFLGKQLKIDSVKDVALSYEDFE
ncbi:N-acetylneuraminic acid condensing enzyme [Synechococcus sp. CC9311]|nr:N-acetylneuraminic acid condensing enzyme [Synechococcus sp. CC9311]